MYQEYPKDLVVETPLGSVKLTITEAAHIYVESNDVLMISGKPIRVTLHMMRRNGEWSDKSENGRSSIYAKKPYVMSMQDDATPTQKEKAIAVIVPTVAKFANNNPDLLKQAQVAHVANRVETIQGYIDEKRKEIAEYEKEIANLKATL
jgi:hypothetical protein